jgi:hypothetical protein
MGNIDIAADWLRFAKMDLGSAFVRYPPTSEVTESDALVAIIDASLVFTACEKAIESLRSLS